MNLRNKNEYFYQKNIPSEEHYIHEGEYINEKNNDNISIANINEKKNNLEKMKNNFNIFNLIFKIIEIPSFILSKILTNKTSGNVIQYNLNKSAGIMFCLIVLLLFSSLYIKDIKKFLRAKKTVKSIF